MDNNFIIKVESNKQSSFKSGRHKYKIYSIHFATAPANHKKNQVYSKLFKLLRIANMTDITYIFTIKYMHVTSEILFI